MSDMTEQRSANVLGVPAHPHDDETAHGLHPVGRGVAHLVEDRSDDLAADAADLHPVAHPHPQARAFEQGQEMGGGQEAALRVLPAQQRLKTD